MSTTERFFEHDLDSAAAFKYNLIIWKYFGFVAPKQKMWLPFYFVYLILVNGIILAFLSLFVLNMFYAEGLQNFCEIFYIFISVFMADIKYVNFIKIRRRVHLVNRMWTKLDERIKSKEEVKIVQREIRIVHICVFVLLGLGFWLNFNGQLLVLLSSKRSVMFPAWAPLDWENCYWHFVIIHTLQSFGLFIVSMQDIGNDSFPAAFLGLLSAHLHALAIRVKRLGTENHLSSDERYQQLVQCVKDHLLILELTEKAQDFFSFTSLAQFFATGLGQCTVAVYTLCTDLTFSKLANGLIFLVGLSVEAFFFCVFGDHLKQKHLELTEAIYCCNWLEQDQRFKKSLLVFMMRSQGAKTLMAGNFIPVDLPTFASVLRKAYSFFAVLNKIK